LQNITLWAVQVAAVPVAQVAEIKQVAAIATDAPPAVATD